MLNFSLKWEGKQPHVQNVNVVGKNLIYIIQAMVTVRPAGNTEREKGKENYRKNEGREQVKERITVLLL